MHGGLACLLPVVLLLCVLSGSAIHSFPDVGDDDLYASGDRYQADGIVGCGSDYCDDSIMKFARVGVEDVYTDGTVVAAMTNAFEELQHALATYSKGAVSIAADHAWSAFLALPSEKSPMSASIAGLATQILLGASKIRDTQSILRSTNPCYWTNEMWLSSAMIADDSGELLLAAILYDLVHVRIGITLGRNNTLVSQDLATLATGVPGVQSEDVAATLASKYAFQEPTSRGAEVSAAVSRCHALVAESMQVALDSTVCSETVGELTSELINCASDSDPLVLAALVRIFQEVMIDHNSSSIYRFGSGSTPRLSWYETPVYLQSLHELALRVGSKSFYNSGAYGAAEAMQQALNRESRSLVAKHSVDSRSVVKNDKVMDFFHVAYNWAGVSPPHDDLLAASAQRLVDIVHQIGLETRPAHDVLATNFSKAMLSKYQRSMTFDVGFLDAIDSSQFHRLLIRSIPTLSNFTMRQMLQFQALGGSDASNHVTALPSISSQFAEMRAALLSRELDWSLAFSYSDEFRWQQAQLHIRQVSDADAALFGVDHVQYARTLVAMAFMQIQAKSKMDCTAALTNLHKAKDILTDRFGTAAARKSLLYLQATVLSGHSYVCVKNFGKAVSMYERVAASTTSAQLAAEAASLLAMISDEMNFKDPLEECHNHHTGATFFSKFSRPMHAKDVFLPHVHRYFKGWVAYSACLTKAMTVTAKVVKPLYDKAAVLWDAIPSVIRRRNRVFEAYIVRLSWVKFLATRGDSLHLGQASILTAQFLSTHATLTGTLPSVLGHAFSVRDQFLPRSGIDTSGLFVPRGVHHDRISEPFEETREMVWAMDIIVPIRDYFGYLGLHLDEQDPVPRMAEAADLLVVVPMEGFQLYRTAQAANEKLLRSTIHTPTTPDGFAMTLLQPEPLFYVLKALRHVRAGIVTVSARLLWALQTNHSTADWYGLHPGKAVAGSGLHAGMHSVAVSPPITCVMPLVNTLQVLYDNLNEMLLRTLVMLGAVQTGKEQQVEWTYFEHPNQDFRRLIGLLRTVSNIAFEYRQQFVQIKERLRNSFHYNGELRTTPLVLEPQSYHELLAVTQSVQQSISALKY